MRVVSELRCTYPLEGLLKLAGIPRSTYFAIFKRLDRKDKHAELRAEICDICREHAGLYGYRRVTMELHNRGYNAKHKDRVFTDSNF